MRYIVLQFIELRIKERNKFIASLCIYLYEYIFILKIDYYYSLSIFIQNFLFFHSFFLLFNIVIINIIIIITPHGLCVCVLFGAYLN